MTLPTRVIWLDLETTGLDPEEHLVLEMGMRVARFDDPCALGDSFHRVLFHDGKDLDPFILDMHTKNGLLAECAASKHLEPAVEKQAVEFVSRACAGDEEKTVLAGSTVHFDLGFLRRSYPRLAELFSHRLLDVSAVKLFCQAHGMPELPKGEAHRALDDIQESVGHLVKCALFAGWVKL